MRFAIIDKGVVVNIVEASNPLSPSWVVAGNADIGDQFIDGELIRQRVVTEQDALKNARYQLVNEIIVTTQSGRSFDGDEDAQNRMSRAINAMEDTDTVPWVLADNTVALVSRVELKEALKLAGAAMAEVWVRPYQT